jgi:hypothetical protein
MEKPSWENSTAHKAQILFNGRWRLTMPPFPIHNRHLKKIRCILYPSVQNICSYRVQGYYKLLYMLSTLLQEHCCCRVKGRSVFLPFPSITSPLFHSTLKIFFFLSLTASLTVLGLKNFPVGKTHILFSGEKEE